MGNSCKDIKKECYYTEEYRFQEMIGDNPDNFDWRKLLKDNIIPHKKIHEYIEEGRFTIYDLNSWEHEDDKELVIAFKEQIDFSREKTYRMQTGWLYNIEEFRSELDKDFFMDNAGYLNVKITSASAESIYWLYTNDFIDLTSVLYTLNDSRFSDDVKMSKEWDKYLIPLIVEKFEIVIQMIIVDNFPTRVYQFIYTILKENCPDKVVVTNDFVAGSTVLSVLERNIFDYIVSDSYFLEEQNYFPKWAKKHLTDDMVKRRFAKLQKKNFFNMDFYINRKKFYNITYNEIKKEVK